MYRVKANGNYNIVINDLGVSILATQVDGLAIEKERFNNSLDAKKLLEAKLIVFHEEVAKASNKKVVEPKKEEKVFVSEGNVTANPADVFIRNEGVLELDKKVEEVTKVEDIKEEPLKDVEAASVKEVVEEKPVKENTKTVVKEEEKTKNNNAGVKKNTPNKNVAKK